MHMRNALVTIGMAAMIAATASWVLAAPGGASVEEMLFAVGIESRMPVGVADEFDASTRRVVCWTRIAAESPPVTVRHVWVLEGNQLAEVPLTVNYPSGRYWSTKNVIPGVWRVDVVDEAGAVLGSKTFVVTP
jgi:hypothetical protein